MGKTWEKKEYESKQIASTFWWDSALIQIILSIVWLVVGINLLKTLNATILTILSAIIGIVSVLISENLAIKKVRNRAIVKKSQVNEIVKKFAIKYIILIVLIVLVDIFTNSLSISNLIIWIVEAIFGTILAKKLLVGLAVD